ncbi:MAG: enoyl-CoA hydratase/isomerase family protein, partial [Terriglobales bacterium]
TQRAFALMGPARARRMLFTGEHITGRQAAEFGLVNESVPLADLLPTAEHLARQILSNGPGAVRLAKRVFCNEETSWLEKGLAGEAEAFGEAFLNEEAREGLRAFLEKRLPAWAPAATT